MALIRTEAFVVQAFRYGETSLICRLLTRERGLVAVIAKGARRPRNRFGARLEPFHRLGVTYSDRSGRDLQTLTDVERLEEHAEIVGSLERMEAGGTWLRFLRRVVAENAPAEPLFDLAAVGLRRLAAIPPRSAARWETYHRVATAALLGLAPSVDTCAACGRGLPDPDGMAFDAEEGGVVCAGCRAGRRGAPVGRAEYGLLALYRHPEWELVAGLPPGGAEEARAREWLQRFVAWHADAAPAGRGWGR